MPAAFDTVRPEVGLHDQVLTTPVPGAEAVNVMDAPLGMIGAVVDRLEFNTEDDAMLTLGLLTFCNVTGVNVYAQTSAFFTPRR